MKDSLNSVVLYNFQIHTYNLIDFFLNLPSLCCPFPTTLPPLLLLLLLLLSRFSNVQLCATP